MPAYQAALAVTQYGDEPMIEINGMAHVILTVSRFEVARAFYRELLPRFGMKPVFDGDHLFYCVGGRTAIGIQPCDPALGGEHFVQQRVGLHHLCLRARSRKDVDRCASMLREMNATIVRGPEDGSWAPGLLRAVRRPRRHSPGGMLRAGGWPAGGRRVIQSRRRLRDRLSSVA